VARRFWPQGRTEINCQDRGRSGCEVLARLAAERRRLPGDGRMMFPAHHGYRSLAYHRRSVQEQHTEGGETGLSYHLPGEDPGADLGGLVWAATGLWSTLRHYPGWNGAEGALTIIPWIMLGSIIAVVLAIRGPRLKPFFGVFERLFYLSSITWGLIVAIDLARISG
jgi:hypothetical protein